MPTHSRLLGHAGPVLAVLFMASAQAAPVLSEVTVLRTQTDGTTNTQVISGVNSAGKKSSPNDYIGVSHSYLGQASAEFQTLRSAVSAGGNPPSIWSDFNTRSRFVTNTVVSGGGSGQTTLNLALRVDGSSTAHGAIDLGNLPLNSARSLELGVGTGLHYRIVDLDWIDPELGNPITLLDFEFSSGVSWTGSRVHQADGGWGEGGGLFRGTHAQCTVGCQPGPDTWVWSGSWTEGGFLDHVPGGFASVDADTGWLNFSFDAVVGHELLIEAVLEAGIHTWGCDDYCVFSGSSDFSHTFDAELTAQDAGITLIGLREGIAPPLSNDNNPVPEPSSAALAAVALFGLRRAAQRAKRAKRSASASISR